MLVCSPTRRVPRRVILLAGICFGVMAVLCVPHRALAQHHGGGGPGGPGGGFGGGFARGDIGGTRPSGGGNQPSMRSGLQLGPPGRWWDDKHFVKQLHLRPDQQRRMDAIFEQNRGTLLKRFESLQQEQQRMDALTHAPTLDENALFAQIDRVAQAKADLEKANTHYLFQLRGEMDSDQVARLEGAQ
jgi:hypothetical protein